MRVRVLPTVLALVLVVAACGRGGEFQDRTAVVALGGSSQTYQVVSCGRDGRTVFLVARAPDGAVLQGVLGLAADRTTGVPASTGLTVDLDPTTSSARVAAFGAESWARREQASAPPGTITAARLRGSRIQFSGEVVPVDSRDRPLPDATGQRFSVDARCDETTG